MSLRAHVIRVSGLGLAYAFVAATPAFAYLDGATGSILLQALVGGLATTAVFGRTVIARIKSLFSGKRAPDSE